MKGEREADLGPTTTDQFKYNQSIRKSIYLWNIYFKNKNVEIYF
jgi:hypothetical protein